MKVLKSLCALSMTSATAGCVLTDTASAPMGLLALQSASCIHAVRAETNHPDVVELGSDLRGALRDFSLEVGRTGIRGCRVTASGMVTSVEFPGSDGSPLA